MTTEKIKTQNGLAAISKDMVTVTKDFTVAAREGVLGPMMGMFGHAEPVATGMRPWLDMTRSAHDQWLKYWESQSHAVIDRTFEWMTTKR
jgi:hypothetical protein